MVTRWSRLLLSAGLVMNAGAFYASAAPDDDPALAQAEKAVGEFVAQAKTDALRTSASTTGRHSHFGNYCGEVTGKLQGSMAIPPTKVCWEIKPGKTSNAILLSYPDPLTDPNNLKPLVISKVYKPDLSFTLWAGEQFGGQGTCVKVEGGQTCRGDFHDVLIYKKGWIVDTIKDESLDIELYIEYTWGDLKIHYSGHLIKQH